ncbi:DNA processing protein [Persephonella hydrogeniphila]|uniref:DNA processing protein n=1 Tax=Persephonella hydrogeniphila TaxID=198703 RepID=A0A285NK96_9AQUI|nr:DNA-processing protein DprA [Persephonella hydrogeniphila]SNZ09944.1 DNA processing protein [Persephonella hydrogeniphila]
MSIIDYIEISFIKGIGKSTIKQIYEEFADIGAVLKNPELLKEQFGQKVYLSIKNRDSSLRKKAEEEYRKASKKDIKILTLQDENYPSMLKEIPDPPSFLYASSEIPDVPLISVVGSRKHTYYGKSVTREIVKKLVENGIGIVSGLASGIDRIAHETALENNGFTIAVLGGGIDRIFPYENRDIYTKIKKEGVLISEFPIGQKPTRYTFPIRNRIIAGLSAGVIVTEASERSGALITARTANEYGRVVFSVPSNINNPYGKGCNILLKEGAIPLTGIEDVFENLPYLDKKESPAYMDISDVEKLILDSINQPVHIDLLSEKTNIDTEQIIVILFEMEIKGLLTVENGIVVRNI